MDRLIEQLKSADFWVFGVMLAIVLSVLGNYATRFVDRGFQFGTSRIRALSTRSREKRAVKIKHVNEWIDTHENASILVLSEAHFLCFLGLSMTVLLISSLLLIRTELAVGPLLPRVLIAVLTMLAAIIAIAAMNVGGFLLDAVRNHPKGLQGLHPHRVKP